MDRSLPLSSSLEELLSEQRQSVQSLAEQLGQAKDFEQRLREAVEELQQEFDRRLAVKQAELRAQTMLQADEVRIRTRRESSEVLSRLARQMDEAVDVGEWKAAVLGTVERYCRTVVLWSISGGRVVYEGHRSEEHADAGHWEDIEFPLQQAAAIAAVVASMETVVCQASERELSRQVYAALSPGEHQRIYLIPILTGRAQGQRRTAAILMLDPHNSETIDTGWLEALAIMAGALHECRILAGKKPSVSTDLLGIAPALSAIAEPPKAESSGKPQDREIHQKAQRFARVKIAEIRLYQSQQVIDGRTQKDLYTMVREPLDRAREEYAQQFLSTPGIPDYLHAEIVQTLANGDAGVLGEDYPGPLA